MNPVEIKQWAELGISVLAFLSFVALVFKVGLPLVQAVEAMSGEFRLLRQALSGEQMENLVREMRSTRHSLEGMNRAMRRLEGVLERKGFTFRMEDEVVP